MPNYAQLNQGLRDVRQIGSNLMDYQTRNRQLDISQENSDRSYEINKRDQDRKDTAMAEDMRRQNNLEFGNTWMQVATEAANATRADGSAYDSTGSFLTDNAAARDAVVNGLGKSNSEYRKMAAGRPMRTVAGPDGKFQVEVNEEGNWQPMAGVDGQPVSVGSDELVMASRLEAASAGRAEIIRLDKELQERVAAGEVSEEEGEAQRAQYSQAMGDIFTTAEQNGISPEDILAMEEQGARNNTPSAADSAATSPLRIDDSQEVAPNADQQDMVGPPENPNVGPGGMAGLPWAAQRDMEAVGNHLAESRPSQQVPNAARVGYAETNEGDSLSARAGKGIRNLAAGAFNEVLSPAFEINRETIGKVTESISDFFVNGVFASAEAGEEIRESVKVPVGDSDVTMRTQPTAPAERRAGQANAATSTAQRNVSRLSDNSSADDRRRAAITYSNGMLINGLNPNPSILANLEAGDNMRGDLLRQAELDLEYSKLWSSAQNRAQNSPTAKAVTSILDNMGDTFNEHTLQRMNLTPEKVNQLAYTTYGANKAALRNEEFPDDPAQMSLSQAFLYTTAFEEALSLHGTSEGSIFGFAKVLRNTKGQLSDSFKSEPTLMDDIFERLGPQGRAAFVQQHTLDDGSIDYRGMDAQFQEHIREERQSRTEATEARLR